MAFLTYQATEEDKQQTNRQTEKITYIIKKGTELINSIVPKVLTPATKQQTKQDPTLTCKYFKCFKSFGNINEILKSEGKKKKDLKQICNICAACHAFI